MVLNPHVLIAHVLSMLNIIRNAIDAGVAAGYVEIRSGTQPATVSDAATGTVLATITLQDPALSAAADQNPNGRCTLNGTPADSSADATGTAAWGRVYDSAGNAVFDGSCGVGASFNFNIDSTAITALAAVTLNSMNLNMNE